jgi:S1-C subfamily serine protease
LGWNSGIVNTFENKSEEPESMSTTSRKGPFVAALLAAAVAGGGVGAAVYAGAAGTNDSHTATVTQAAPVVQATKISQVGAIYRATRPGVVEIDVTGSSSSQNSFPFGGGGSQQTSAEGTGFVLDSDGNIVTNEHVVSSGSNIHVKFADGSIYKATVVGDDPSSDLAVIHVNAPSDELRPLPLGDSNALQVGDGVVAIGNPFGLDGTLTSGIVSALGREIDSPNGQPIENAIQTDAAINHGNSGGPLLDLNGKVVGVTSQIQSDSGGNEGVGFAVPVNTVKLVVNQILSHGTAKHALLGVRVTTVPASVAAALGIQQGVVVTTVEPSSSAAKAGLKAGGQVKSLNGTDYPTNGDTITKVDGQPITTAEQLRGVIDAHAPGDKVKLTIVRNGKTRTVTATLGARTQTS